MRATDEVRFNVDGSDCLPSVRVKPNVAWLKLSVDAVVFQSNGLLVLLPATGMECL